MGPTFQTGRQIGRYEIESFVGRGGMSTVYRARLLGPAQASKLVALKLIHSHLARKRSFVLMFLDEMRLAMKLEHRNVVQTFDAGQVDDDYFLVMEHVDGGSLLQLLERQRATGEALPLDIAVFVAMEVCAALDYAHGLLPRGVVHRDVSPGNILLSRQGDVKLADFGVAKAAGQLAHTQVDMFKGKLEYMAPEQARGEPNPRSDVFSLGIMLYELIGGEPLRRQPTLDSVRSHRGVKTPLESLREGISPRLDRAVMRCLAPGPDDRPDADEMRQELRGELRRLVHDDGPEPHIRLRDYLADLVDAPESGTSRVAQALIAKVKELPVDRGHRRRTVTSEAGAPAGAPSDAPSDAPRTIPLADEEAAEAGPGGAQNNRMVYTATVAILLVSGVIIWLLATEGTGTEAVVQAAIDAAWTPPVRDSAAAGQAVLGRATVKPAASKRRIRPRRPRRRRTGRLTLNTEPWTAVFIDGRRVGETPIEGLALSSGFHSMLLVNRGEKISRTLRIRISPGKTLRKVLVLH
jgi:eukaryotic-like serine/threonine-protein kinase